MINRETAIGVLEDLTGSGFFDDALCDSLNEIQFCIEAERLGYHLWGASDEDCNKLFPAVRNDMNAEEVKELSTKYKYGQAPFEQRR